MDLPPFLSYCAFVPNCIESIQVVFRFPVAVSSLFSLHIIDFFVYAAVFSVLIAASKFIFIYDEAGCLCLCGRVLCGSYYVY